MTQPTVFVLSGEFITTEADPTKPPYHLSRSIDSLTHTVSSIQFSQVTKGDAHDTEDPFPPTKLYNLVHPSNAAHRTDIPAAWFIIDNSETGAGLGNLKLLPSTRRKHLPFSKPAFSALLHASANSSTSPLFPPAESDALEPFFTAKQSLTSRAWEWLDGSGKQVLAREEAPDRKQQLPPRLVVTATNDMTQGTKDALVALWVLRLWWVVAEEKKFQESALLEYMTPDSFVPGGMNALTKRTAGLGAFAALGAC